MKAIFIVIGIFVILLTLFFNLRTPGCEIGPFEMFQSYDEKILNSTYALYFLKTKFNQSSFIQESTIEDIEYKEILGNIQGWVLKNEIAIDKDGNIYERGPCI